MELRIQILTPTRSKGAKNGQFQLSKKCFQMKLLSLSHKYNIGFDIISFSSIKMETLYSKTVQFSFNLGNNPYLLTRSSQLPQIPNQQSSFNRDWFRSDQNKFETSQKDNQQESSNRNKINEKKDQQIRKLKILQKAKKDSIDTLNIKIISMVSKLSSSGFSSSSLERERLVKQRFKTEYTTFNNFTNDLEIQSNKEQLQKKKQLEEKGSLSKSILLNRTKFSGLSRQEYKQKSAKKYELQRIRSKYKDHGKNLKQTPQTMDGLDYKNFIKSRKDPNLSSSLAVDKENFSIKSIQLGRKREYNPRRVKQSDRKEVLLKECLKKRPLQDSTNFNRPNAKLHHEDLGETSNQHKFQSFFTFVAKNQKEEYESEPPTADFRMNQRLDELQLFLKSIIGQIQLDGYFRKAKKWFNLQSSQSKWKDLSLALLKKGIDFDQESIRQIFTINEEEKDPFCPQRQQYYLITDVAESFISCEENWFMNIVKKYNRLKLESSGFIENRIDISRKDYLGIEDLVRFLNLEMDVHYRNRDMFLIYLRLQSHERLTFQDIIEVICH